MGGAAIEVPSTWYEITGEVDAADPPFSLADMSKDVGALQLSVARYEAGPVPDPSPGDLLAIAAELGARHGLTDPHDTINESGRLRLGAISYRGGDDFIRIWYVSDGKNFAKVTYTCRWGRESEQVAEREAIVRSVRFP